MPDYAHMKSTLSPWFVRLSHGPMKLLYAAQKSGGTARVSPDKKRHARL